MFVTNRRFWQGFLAGAATTVISAFAAGLLGRSGQSRIIRLEKSLQIGRGVEEVFQTWNDLESLPRYTSLLRNIHRRGDHSHWIAEVGGRPVEWDAEIVQSIPNEVIGWKSVSGLRHTGRITFSPVGGQTLVHVHMNFEPRPRLLRPLFSTMAGEMEGYIEQALRDVKSAIESGRTTMRGRTGQITSTKATGTYGQSATSPRFDTESDTGDADGPPEFGS